MNDGTYSLYMLTWPEAQDKEPSRKLAARFILSQGRMKRLEDHHFVLHDVLPDGVFSQDHVHALAHLLQSGYYRLVNEGDVEQGKELAHVPEMDLGPVQADAAFMLTTPSDPTPKRVEVVGEVVTVDGTRLTDSQAEALLGQVQTGAATLTAIEEQEA